MKASFDAAYKVYDFLGDRKNLGIHYSHHAHAFTDEDWTAMMDFMDRQLRGMKSDKTFDQFLTMDRSARLRRLLRRLLRPAGATGQPAPSGDRCLRRWMSCFVPWASRCA